MFIRIRAIYHIIVSNNFLVITDMLNIGHIRKDEGTIGYYLQETRKAVEHLEAFDEQL